MYGTKTLAILRAENNMSQRELAKRLHISCGTIGIQRAYFTAVIIPQFWGVV